ncbi:hypothetical protein EI555_004612 [Monodon monoceros]|uniref:Uncharacterized protein n=1 Tax=Monodon monoceros TaxID=40151 RepID=A0A4U1FR81_MONMO|nr:hypothetical protein EI555_004612 [Monodon monoceros]
MTAVPLTSRNPRFLEGEWLGSPLPATETQTCTHHPHSLAVSKAAAAFAPQGLTGKGRIMEGNGIKEPIELLV